LAAAAQRRAGASVRRGAVLRWRAPEVKPLRLLIVLAVVAGALVSTAVWLGRHQPAHVTVRTIDRGRVQSSVANTRAGTITANLRAKLAPPMGGQVARLCVKEGDHVTKDQVLLELWNEDLKAQHEVAKAEAERALAMAQEAQLRAEWADRDAKRQEELLLKDIYADQAVDKARSDARASQASWRAAIAFAEVQKHQVAVIEAQLQRTRLLAPFSGIVAEVNGEVGEFVTPSPVGIPTPPAIDLIDDGIPYVTAPIDEVDAAKVRVGQDVRITIDAFGKRPFAGRVRRIAPYVLDHEKQARTVDVDVDFVDLPKEAQMLPGYSADVEIVLAVQEDAVRVPTEALREGSKVFVVGADGVLAERTLELGIANWQFAEAKNGVAPGERVVVTFDRDGVVAGALVEVQGTAAASARKSGDKP
jgi:HlyD family secretion protein